MMIREATEADTDRLVQMATRFLESSTTYGAILPPDPARVASLVAACLAVGVIVVAESRDGVLVGLLGVVHVTHPFSAAQFVEEQAWWVEPEYRRGTVGPRLVNYVLEWARVQGLQFVKMGAPADAPQVGLFYERLGFKAVETAYVKELQ
jgi:GNAT superfamily N-acetyltransferase